MADKLASLATESKVVGRRGNPGQTNSSAATQTGSRARTLGHIDRDLKNHTISPFADNVVCRRSLDQGSSAIVVSMTPFRLVLPTGTPILVRPVQPEDKPHFVIGLNELSERTLRERFHSNFRPTDKQLDYLTRVDQHDHLALVAVDKSGADDHGAGVARCIRREKGGHLAEIAITVVDHYQRQGVATVLLAALSRAAAAEGIDTFVAYLDAERRALLRYVAGLRGTLVKYSGGVAEVHFHVLIDPDDLPDTASADLFRSTLEIIEG